jgi:hypothetical protein
METGAVAKVAMPPSLGHILDFQVDTIAEPEPVTLAPSQERARLFGGFGFDAPIFDAGHLDRRVEQFAFSLGYASRHVLGRAPLGLVVGHVRGRLRITLIDATIDACR